MVTDITDMDIFMPHMDRDFRAHPNVDVVSLMWTAAPLI